MGETASLAPFFPYKSAAFWCQGGSGQLSHRDMNANVQANWLFLQRVDAWDIFTHDYVWIVTVYLHGQGRWWLISTDWGSTWGLFSCIPLIHSFPPFPPSLLHMQSLGLQVFFLSTFKNRGIWTCFLSLRSAGGLSTPLTGLTASWMSLINSPLLSLSECL